MDISFKGCSLTIPDAMGLKGFMLTVAGESVTFAPKSSEQDKPDEGTYLLTFQCIPVGQKIPVIKEVREALGLHLGDAKYLVEGNSSQPVYIRGPKWEKSRLRERLEHLGCVRGTHFQVDPRTEDYMSADRTLVTYQ